MSGEIGSASKIKRSAEIGNNIQEEIMKWLPVKPIIRFRCVCKAWKCLIDSSYFIASHTARQYQRQHLLLPYSVGEEAFPRFVFTVDDETFPQQSFLPTIPLSIKRFTRFWIIGSCNGLLCLHGSYVDPDSKFRRPLAVLWNPAIRKSITITVPGISHVMDQSVLGFWVSPVTNDPMIVRVIQLVPPHEKASEINHPWDVMVYSLSSGKWRRPSGNVPSKSIRLKSCGLFIDRFIYWYSAHMRAVEGRIEWKWTSNLIMSFDTTNDTFKMIDLPDSLAHNHSKQLSISKLKESLVVLVDNFQRGNKHCDVWMMDNGAQRLFTKLFTIKKPLGIRLIRALGFRKSGASLVEVKDYGYRKGRLVVYEHNSKPLNDLEICRARCLFPVDSYMETLLLLGRSDCISY